MKVILNPDKEIVKKIRKGLEETEGYCPCRIEKIPENKCMCKEFRDMIENKQLGECHCGLYIITDNE